MEQQDSPLRIVIVGGVAGGATAAARARRCNANAEITILERGQAVSFANCGLPYHIGGEIEDREKLLVATPKLFWDRFRVRVRTGHEVRKIDREARTVTGVDSAGEEFKVPYDKLIISLGSEPVRPAFLKDQGDNVFQLWTLEDMDKVIAHMKKRACKKAAVIGAGFVGLEVAEQLARKEIAVSVVEQASQVLVAIDSEMASLTLGEFEKNKVKLFLGSSVASLLTNNKTTTAIKLEDGNSIATDMVIVSAGVGPRIQLAEEAGLEIGETGAVSVNEFCQTSDPNIYAVGDMIEYQHRVLAQARQSPFAGPANRAGRVAGTHAATGVAKPMGPVLWTSVIRVFGLSVATTGLTEKACKSAGIECRVATIQAPHHASYFPGAKGLTLKIVYRPDGRLLGAQCVGPEGVDKRIDVIATILHFGGTVDDLADLDLAYAPPFGSAKDPVHMAAFVAQNDLCNQPSLAPYDAELSEFQVVDVRAASEFDKLPMEPGAIHIPVDEIADRLGELDPSRPTVVVCHSGKRAHVAASRLRGKGFSVVQNLNGGMSLRKWRDLGK